MKRYKPNRKNDKRSFTKNAQKTHVRNLPSNPMRGGIRL